APRRLERDVRQSIGDDEEPAHLIDDRQWIAILAVAQPELSLEVGRPQLPRLVRKIRSPKWHHPMRSPRPFALFDQPRAVEDRVHGRAVRPLQGRMLLAQSLQNLLRAEAPALPLGNQQLLDLPRRLARLLV